MVFAFIWSHSKLLNKLYKTSSNLFVWLQAKITGKLCELSTWKIMFTKNQKTKKKAQKNPQVLSLMLQILFVFERTMSNLVIVFNQPI